jgi:hypothetical protein
MFSAATTVCSSCKITGGKLAKRKKKIPKANKNNNGDPGQAKDAKKECSCVNDAVVCVCVCWHGAPCNRRYEEKERGCKVMLLNTSKKLSCCV